MNHQYRLARACACLLLSLGGVHAHAQQAVPAAADPQAAVPATAYQSALAHRPEAAPTSTPDATWVANNQTVAATNSMALTMKGMAGHGQAADPHAGHAGHAGMPGMAMDKKDSADMCTPGAKGGKGDGKGGGEGRMSCCGSGCGSCCESCCKGGMKKDKEAA
jgi:hypothetical protein